tara:strand:- start:184 stop:540 length:357 start_codon:yes stop_codon:yes gene_type:complete
MIKIKKIKIIKNKKGNIVKFLNKYQMPFKNFGEIYFSEVKKKYFKGWKYHNDRDQILTVVSGKIEFSFKKKLNSKLKVVRMEFPNKIFAIYIPRKTHYSFRCISKEKGMIANIINKVI